VTRTLNGITTANTNGTTYLSENLSKGGKYLCAGEKPWLGQGAIARCGRPLRGSLRGAGNIYFAELRSALFLPRTNPQVSQRLLKLLDEPVYASVVRLMEEETTPAYLRKKSPDPLKPFTDNQIKEALRVVLAGRKEVEEEEGVQVDSSQLEAALRVAEFEALRSPRTDDDLVVRVASVSAYDPFVRRFLSGVSLVEKLRETRAFVGFSRVFPKDGRSIAERNALLWRQPPLPRQSWLPAHVVFGEGIFLTFDEGRLSRWEHQMNVQERARMLADRYSVLQAERHLRARDISARFLMLHTFAHLLMTRLTFECGYTSASLRERLYVSTDVVNPMAGILIYTAAGDSDGTMGGLVRMGRAGQLEPVVRRAIETAQWCSADPVCIENRAQGPLSCNLAACHSCALVPETACEELNRFLDRALVVGTTASPDVGFFAAGGR
jgi:hypothetical protein